MITTPTNLDYLIPDLRLYLGDINPTEYRYLTEWLRTALVGAVKALRMWWRYKYIIDEDTYIVTRNPQFKGIFQSVEPPIIDHSDEFPLVIMASIIIKSGSLQNNSWNLIGWSDSEIKYAPGNVGREQSESLKRDWAILKDYFTAPTKKLATPDKVSLYGFRKNSYERDITDLG